MTQNSNNSNSTYFTFAAYESGFVRKNKWVVRLYHDSIEFINSKDNSSISVSKDQWKDCIEFGSIFISGCNVLLKDGDKRYKLIMKLDELQKLRSLMPGLIKGDMKKYLQQWGVGLIILGVFHLIWVEYLDPIWGVLILVLGILNLIIIKRGMIIVNGTAILIAGAMNTFIGTGSWTAFGIAQLILGIKEMLKFRHYE